MDQYDLILLAKVCVLATLVILGMNAWFNDILPARRAARKDR